MVYRGFFARWRGLGSDPLFSFLLQISAHTQDENVHANRERLIDFFTPARKDHNRRGFRCGSQEMCVLRSERTGTCPSSAIPSASGLGLPPLKRYRTRTPAKLLQVRHLSQIAARRRAKTASGQRAASGHSSGRGAPAQARPRRCRLCASATLSLSLSLWLCVPGTGLSGSRMTSQGREKW